MSTEKDPPAPPTRHPQPGPAQPQYSTPEGAPPPTHEYDTPKDFHLAPPGSRDYVAGQPVDDEELKKVDDEAEKKREDARKAAEAAAAKLKSTPPPLHSPPPPPPAPPPPSASTSKK